MSQSSGVRPTILVVDDTSENIDVLRGILGADYREHLKIQSSSFRRRPESSIFNRLDTGLRRCDEFLEVPYTLKTANSGQLALKIAEARAA